MSGEAPEGWRASRLSDVVRIVTDGISADDLSAIPTVHHYSLPSFDERRRPEIGPGAAIKSNKTLVPPDCVLFSKLNPRIPRIWRVREISSPHSYCSTEFWPLVRTSDQIDLDFLAYLVGSDSFLSDPTITPSSSTNSHQRVDRKSFESFRLLLPRLDEQRRIVEVLRSADGAVASARSAAEQAHRVLDTCVAALMHNGIHGPREGSEYADLPAGWREGRCDSFLVLQRGFDITEKQAEHGAFQVISSSGPSYFHREAAVNGPAVITGRKGRLGTVFYSDMPCWPHDTTLWVRDFKGNDARFVYWKLREMKLGAYDAATSVPTLNRNNVHAVNIRFPPLDEQRKIAAFLDDCEAMLERQSHAAASAVETKRVLIDELLSGRVRVPE